MASKKRRGGKASKKRKETAKRVAARRADKQLSRYIDDNQSLKNQDAGVASIVQDMPKKFADNFINSRGEIGPEELGKKSRYYRADGSLNSAGLATLSQYTDERPEYSRQLNRLRTSSPAMMDAYARKFPVENFAMKAGPMIAGAATGIPFGVMDLFNKGRNKFTNLSDRDDILGAIARTTNDIASSFTPEQAKNIDTNIETKKPIDKVLRDENIINASTDVNPILKAADAQTGSQDIVDIFDNDGEKAAIDASLPTGDIVYNPYVEAPYQSKLDFINEVYGTDFTADRSGILLGENQANELFEKAKQEQGGIIREEVNRDLNVDDTDPIPGGQFNLTRPTINEDTVPVILGGAGPDYEYGDFMINEDLGNVIPTDNMFPEGGVSGTPVTQAGQGLVFSDGTPVTQPVDTGINTPAGQAAIDILNSNATNDVKRSPDYNQSMLYQDLISGPNPTTDLMTQNPNLSYSDINDLVGGLSGGASSGTPDFGYFADGGSTNKYQNMSTHEKLMRMAAEMYG